MMLAKPNSNFVYRQCNNNGCRFRFPAEAGADQGAECPSCGSITLVVGATPSSADRPSLIDNLVTPRIAVFLDNIRSSYNVGSIFRTANGAGINQVILGGISPTPDHPKVAKTALGADITISWAYYKNGLEGVLGFKDRGWRLWALESGSNCQPLFHVESISKAQKIMIIVGNERAGVDPGILDVCDRILSLPMNGQKRSLNVSVAFGIAAYWLRYGSSIDE